MLESLPVSRPHRILLVIIALLVLSACNSASTRSEEPDPVPLPSVNLTAAPMQVDMNGQAALAWAATDADSCTASGGWSGERSTSGTESVGPLTQTTTYSIECTGQGGAANRSVTVTVASSPTPSLSLSADRTIVTAGESVTLTWESVLAENCTASGNWSGNKASSGQQTVGPLQSNSSFTLSCDSSAGTLVETVDVSVAMAGGDLTFSADRTSIVAGESVTLSWLATGADVCTASGDWSGSKATSGQEIVGPLQSDSAFTLACRTAGSTLTETVNVEVTAPSLSFTADRTSIDAGQSVTLFWSTEFVDSCTASGDWSGNRATSGQETVGPLEADSAFTLTCATAAGGTLADTVNVGIATSGGELNLEGGVDSHFIDGEGLNRVYIFAGDVQPDDFDGDSGDPVATATVTQDPGACTWSYGLASGLDDGLYTVAFTAEAGSDDPGSDESLNFVGTSTLSISGGSAVHNFVPANVIRVGPTRAITSVSEASTVVNDGDVVEIDAGLYVDDISIWRANNVTLRGINGRPHLRADAIIPYSSGNDQQNGKAIIVAWGDNFRIENLEFSGARVPDRNGAGIRPEGGSIEICNSYFHDNENGILGGGTTVLIEYSEFYNNGHCDGDCAHNLYIGHVDRLIFRHNYSHHANIGHNLKSRAKENYILYSRLGDEASGTGSYTVDLSNGGLSYLIGNLLQQGPNGDNYHIFRYGAEGLSGDATHRLYVANNTFVNDRGTGIFFTVQSGTESALAVNNLFVGNGTVVSGQAEQIGNLQTDSPGFVDRANYDYRLTAGSPAIDAGTAPGSGDGYSLVPIEHYVHPYDTEPRIQSGPIDIGAYEYTP